MRGLGLNIWIIQDCFGGDIQKIIGAVKEAGATRLVVKHYDYTINPTGLYVSKNVPNQPAQLQQLSHACRAAGIEFWVWYYPWFFHGKPEVEGETAGRLAKELNAFGIYVDAEEPWRWSNATDRLAKRDHARRHMAAVRKAFHGPIAFTSYRNPGPGFIDNFPWDDCIQAADYVLPQVYFERNTPKADFERSIRQHALIGHPFKAPKFLPMWPVYSERGWAPTPDEIRQCYALSVEKGFQGADFWRLEWALRNPAHWKAIVEGNPWRVKEAPAPAKPVRGMSERITKLVKRTLE